MKPMVSMSTLPAPAPIRIGASLFSHRTRRALTTQTRKKMLVSLTALVFCFLASVLFATTNYQEPWTSSLDSWAYTQNSCSGTCADVLLTSDGNPSDGVTDKVTGRSKSEAGYWKLAAAWTALGVPSGDTVDSVDGQWDDKTVQTAVACNSSSTMGIQIFDSANTAELSASAVEPAINVAGDTSAWTNHNPTAAVTITSSNAASSTVTLRFNVNPASGNNSSAACELRGDNFKLAIVSHAPAAGGGPHRVHVSRLNFGIPKAGARHVRSLDSDAPFRTGAEAGGVLLWQQEKGWGALLRAPTLTI